jgi:hypothetical protein
VGTIVLAIGLQTRFAVALAVYHMAGPCPHQVGLVFGLGQHHRNKRAKKEPSAMAGFGWYLHRLP